MITVIWKCIFVKPNTSLYSNTGIVCHLCATTMVHVTFGAYSTVPVWEMRKDLNETRWVLRQTRFIGDPGDTFCLYNMKHGYFKYQDWTYSPFWFVHVLAFFTHVPYLMNILFSTLTILYKPVPFLYRTYPQLIIFSLFSRLLYILLPLPSVFKQHWIFILTVVVSLGK